MAEGAVAEGRSVARPAGAVLAAIGGVYAAQGVVGGIALQGMPTVLRDGGAALGQVGLMSLAILPWALKFLWAPPLERWRLPADGGPRRTRLLVVGGQVLMVLLLVALALAGQPGPAPLLAVLAALALLAASVDIACDAYAVERLSAANRGWGNAAQVGGSYLGMFVGAGAFVLLLGAAGWTTALLAMAAALALLTLPFATAREPAGPPRAPHRPTLAAAWRRPAIRIGLVLTAVFQLGPRWVMGLTGPLLLDRGVALSTVGWLQGAGGVAAGVCGTLVGAWLVQRGGAGGALRICLPLQAGLLAAFGAAVLWLPAGSVQPLLALAVAAIAVAAIGFVALYAFLMGHASPRQAGIDFTLFQCADAAVAALAGVLAGFMAQRYGYGACYALAATAALLACFVVPRLARRMPADFPGASS